MEKIDVSVIVITYNDASNISDCLKSILSQKFSGDYEIIVVDGVSSDGTAVIAEEFSRKHKNVRVIVEKSSITQARNIGIRHARYGFVAFTDSDCIVPKDWLKILTKRFSEIKARDSTTAGVGGANIPPKNVNDFTFAIGIAFDSLLGSLGSIQAKRFEKDSPAFSISCTNSLYQKSALKKAGMFSEDLGNQGEDWDIGLKIRKKGYNLYGLKDSYVIHKMRSTPKKFWNNMIFYGDGRMRLIAKHGKESSMKYYLPLVFLAGMLVPLTFIFIRSKILLLPLLYFPTILIYSTYLAMSKRAARYSLLVALTFILLHFGYAIGEIKGLRWFGRRR